MFLVTWKDPLLLCITPLCSLNSCHGNRVCTATHQIHGYISAVWAPVTCQGLSWCFLWIMSLNSHHNSIGMVLLSPFYKLGNLREVIYPRSQSQRMEGLFVKPSSVHIRSPCLLSSHTLCLSAVWESERRLLFQEVPYKPVSGHCWYGCSRRVSVTACVTRICFLFWFLRILGIYNASQEYALGCPYQLQHTRIWGTNGHPVLGAPTVEDSLPFWPSHLTLQLTLLPETAIASAPETAIHLGWQQAS